MTNFFLHHKQTQQTHEYLTFDGLMSVIRQDQNMDNWLIWKPTQNAWIVLKDDQDLMPRIQSYQQASVVPTKPPVAPPPPVLTPVTPVQTTPLVQTPAATQAPATQAPATQAPATQTPAAQTPAQTIQPATVIAAPAQAQPVTPQPKQEDKAKIPTLPAMDDGQFEIIDFQAAPEPAAVRPQSGIATTDEKRKYPRIRCKLRTIITDQSQAFLTYTEDVSLGGVKLQHPLPPEVLKNAIEIYITAPSGRTSIVFRCMAFQDKGGFYRFEFTEDMTDYKSHLASWLDSLR